MLHFLIKSKRLVHPLAKTSAKKIFLLVFFTVISTSLHLTSFADDPNTTKPTKNNQLFKPFKSNTNQRKAAQVNDLTKQPVILWTRLRANFQLDTKEKNPKVKFYINKFSKMQPYINELAYNASPYLYYITEQLEKRGMPTELALLPMVESTFNPHALSPTGAQGIWQIMPATGKSLGLDQNHWYDGRKDILASTQGALDYLQQLHKRFNGDWYLALAAYNTGEGKVAKAIKKNKANKLPTDYWSLTLPKQTKEYVPKLLALAAIIKHPSNYGVLLPTIANKPVFQTVNIEKHIDLKLAAKSSGLCEKKFQQLNPGFKQHKTPPSGNYAVIIPVAHATDFQQTVDTMPHLEKVVINHHPQTNIKLAKTGKEIIHIVKVGDSLSKIAAKHKTSVAQLKSYNNLNKDILVVGKTIKIPGTQNNSSNKIIHTVKSGDSLWKLCKQYSVTKQQLIAENNLDKETLKIGQKLTITASA